MATPAVSNTSVATPGAGVPTPTPLAASQAPRTAPTFLRRLLRDWRALPALLAIGVIVVMAVGAPIFAPYDPNRPDFRAIRKPPSAEHRLGTDATGRDVLSRVIYGGRVSLSVAAVAVLISATIGVAIGCVSGFFGGWVDVVLQRFTEIFMAFPSLLLLITVATALGPSLQNAMIIIGVFGWVGLSRLMRAEILSLKEREFIVAARTAGASTPRIIVRHLLPNAIGPLIVNAVYGLQGAILSEAALSFLGAGVPQPTASWGNMITIATNVTYLQDLPWIWLPPTIMLVLAVLSFSFLGDALARVVRK